MSVSVWRVAKGVRGGVINKKGRVGRVKSVEEMSVVFIYEGLHHPEHPGYFGFMPKKGYGGHQERGDENNIHTHL